MKRRSLRLLFVQGGTGSGNFGHEGRPGEVGGSGPGNGVGYPTDMKGYERYSNQDWVNSNKKIMTPWDRGELQNNAPPWADRTRNKYVVDDDRTVANNKDLRSGIELTPDQIKWVKNMDKWTQSAWASESLVVHRSAVLSEDFISRLQVNASFQDEGFMSTAPDIETSESYLKTRVWVQHIKGTPVMFHLTLPKGQRMGWADNSEFVLPRGNTITITSIGHDETFTLDDDQTPILSIYAEVSQ